MTYIAKSNINHNKVEYKKGDIVEGLTEDQAKALIEAGVLADSDSAEDAPAPEKEEAPEPEAEKAEPAPAPEEDSEPVIDDETQPDPSADL